MAGVSMTRAKIRWNERPVQDRNAMFLLLESSFYAAIISLTSPFLSMYALKLGASDYQLGLVSALPGLLGIFCLIPGSLFIESRKDSKRAVAALSLIAACFYPQLALTPWMGAWSVGSYLLLLGAMQIPCQVFLISWQSFFSDVVPPGRQNVVYARRQQVYTIVSTVVTFFAGLGLTYLPGSEQQVIYAYQIYFLLAFVMGLAEFIMLSRIKGYQSHTTDMEAGRKAIGTALKDSLRILWMNKPFRNFTLIVFLFHLTWYMGWTQFFLFQVNILGANEAWLSYVSVASCVGSIFTFGFWSKVMAKRGPQLLLTIGMLGLGMNPILNAICTSLWPLIPMNILMGMTFSAFQLGLFRNLMDVVPSHNKTLNIAVYTTILNIGAFVMPIVGVAFSQLWLRFLPDYGQQAALHATGVIRLMAGFVMVWMNMRRRKPAEQAEN